MALLSAADPLTCLWSDLLDNSLLADESVVINVHDVLNIIQRTLVLMGNANELLSQARRCNILQCFDKIWKGTGRNHVQTAKNFYLATSFARN